MAEQSSKVDQDLTLNLWRELPLIALITIPKTRAWLIR